MANDSEIWIAKCVAAKLDRLRHGNHVTQEQLRKSIQQITFSAELLKLPVPDVWHPQLADQDRSMRVLLRDRPALAVPRRGTANSLQGYQAVRDRTTDCGKEASSSTAQTQSRTVSLNRNSPVRFQAIGSIAQLHFTTPGVVEKNDQVIESVRAA